MRRGAAPSIEPDAPAASSPPELRRDTIWRDAGYWLALNARFLRADPLVGGLTFLGLIGGIVLVHSMQVRLLVVMGKLTDALVKHNMMLVRSVIESLALVCLAYLVGTLATWLGRYAYHIRWRGHFTYRLCQRWMAQDRFYRLQREGGIDNPEQRIQEDLYLIMFYSMQLIPFVVGAITTSVLSWGMIWKLSRPLSLAPLGLPVTIPTALFIACLVTGLLRVVSAHYAGRKITPIEVVRQRLDADFRHDLGEVREFGEAIALERGGPREERRALLLFERIRTNWWRLTRAELLLVSVNNVFVNISRLVPPLLCIGPVAAGKMTVGQMAVATGTYVLGMQVISIFADEYSVIAQLRACVARIRLFETVLDHPLASGISVVEDADRIVVHDVAIALPAGAPLLNIGRLEVTPGERVLVRGASGAGKSTLLRVLAGLWPYGSGTVRAPSDRRTLFLPQHPYMPTGTLAALLSYPAEPEAYEGSRYSEVLRLLSLEAYADRLDEHAVWRAILSPGEQQRIAAARALLRRPDFVVLDEATSALDSALEAELYEALTKALPKATIISVAHRASVERYHSRAIEVRSGRVEEGYDEFMETGVPVGRGAGRFAAGEGI